MTTFDPQRLQIALSVARMPSVEAGFPPPEVKSLLQLEILSLCQEAGLNIDPKNRRDVLMLSAMGVLCWHHLRAGAIYEVGSE